MLFWVILLISFVLPRSPLSRWRGHVHSYSVQMGPSSLHRRNWTVSARADFVNVRPDSTLGGGPGIKLVLLFTSILPVCTFSFFFLSRVTLPFNLPAFVIQTS